MTSARSLHVAVVGAGAFGGWTALWLRRRGCRVTLLDAWGPGNSRSSSGGESRVIRGIYGPDQVYVDWVVRAFEIWEESEARWNVRLYHPTGTLWMFGGPDDYARTSLPYLQAAGLPAAELDLAEARRRFPQIDFTGITSAFFEERAGWLAARRACRAVAGAFIEEGGELRETAVRPGPVRGERMERLELADGTTLEADVYAFAAGPWLPSLFPDLLGNAIHPTRQEIFFFGTPAGDPRFREGTLPIWLELSDTASFYGIPGNDHRGFKIADDARGEPIDPTTADRTPTPEKLTAARAYVARRFPALAGAPLVESRVCQYENSPDGDLLLDRHPEATNVWILGGGSGHGFKLGPALGEQAAGWILGEGAPLPRFSLARLAGARGASRRTQFDVGRS
ncbi:MAG TPA: FAD-dependent oxidoreductase [Thermoanaerobaculia bacterium]|nr:FAD-dependent oxidoreductase [Thermoanaerobaculia bacterium]